MAYTNNFGMIASYDINSNEEENYEVDDNKEDDHMSLNTKTLQGLKQNDRAVTTLDISLHGRDNKRFFKSVNWNEDVDCIANNAHLKKLTIIGRHFQLFYAIQTAN